MAHELLSFVLCLFCFIMTASVVVSLVYEKNLVSGYYFAAGFLLPLLGNDFLKKTGEGIAPYLAMGKTTHKDHCQFGLYLSVTVQHVLLTLANYSIVKEELLLEAPQYLWILAEKLKSSSPFYNMFSADDSLPSNLEGEIGQNMHNLYLMFVGWSSVSVLILVFFEKQERNFVIFSLHHFLQLYLLAFSWFVGTEPIGVVVLFLHMVSDLPLDFSRLLHHINYDYEHIGFPLLEFFFALNAFTWPYFRLYLLPAFAIVPSFLYRHEYFAPIAALQDNLVFSLLCFLSVLNLMHVYWYWKIIGVAVKMIKGSDIRSSIEVKEKGGE